MTKMPEIQTAIDASDLSTEEKNIAQAIVGRGGCLRSSKPTKNGDAAYVWRMVAFYISPQSQHHCIPMTADFDIRALDPVTGKWSSKLARERAKELDKIVDQIVDHTPKLRQHGVMRWARALG